MLEVRHISKKYITGDLTQTALDDVTLAFRDQELVSILGPSGSGKTTMLNIIGGLDRYDSGDLIINGISTKKYNDRDWDTYRNHSIGFVFQSYNLIQHQTVLANVELALTISGISKRERRKRAIRALQEVGLGEQIHKKPNQMSGGQMQRVAIARALVNDPEILLADEPTGALDTKTGIQVMELLKEVAKKRLVIMVTHNPDLAEQYSTRIVRVQDGKLISDTNPVKAEENQPTGKKPRKLASMSFLTALALSANNLRTKKGRTTMTAFAGSIGIIGIALILALSSGVQDYINNIEKNTLSEYPLEINSTGFDFSSMLSAMTQVPEADETEAEEQDMIKVREIISSMFSKISSNDLASLKTYIDNGGGNMKDYVSAVEYSYDLTPQIYMEKGNSVRKINPDNTMSGGSSGGFMSEMSGQYSMRTSAFYSLPEKESIYIDDYEVKAGHWPEDDHEVVLVLNSDGSISDYLLYPLGLRDYDELDRLVKQYSDNETEVIAPEHQRYSYEEIMGKTFKLISGADYYEYNEDTDVWVDKTENEEYLKRLVAQGETLTLVGIVQPKERGSGLLYTGINYPYALTRHISDLAKESDVVKAQLKDPNKNIFTGKEFKSEDQGFDLDKLLTIDEDALKDAFDMSDLSSGMNFDMSGLNFDMSSFKLDTSKLDLSKLMEGVDMSSMDMDLSQLDLSNFLQGITIDLSPEILQTMASGLLMGYQTYQSIHPDKSYHMLMNGFQQYMKDAGTQAALREYLLAFARENISFNPSIESVNTLFTTLLNDYQQYITDNLTTDVLARLIKMLEADLQGAGDDGNRAAMMLKLMGNYREYARMLLSGEVSENLSVSAYVATGRPQSIFNTWAQENIVVNTDMTSMNTEKFEAFIKSFVDGYSSYAAQNSLISYEDVGSGFQEYLSSEGAKTTITESVMKMVDTKALSEQFAAVLKSAMGSVTSAYTSSMSDAMQKMMKSLGTQLATQISGSIQKMMTQVMSRLGSTISDSMSGAFNEEIFSKVFQFNMDSDSLSEMLSSMTSLAQSDYEGNLATLGYVDYDSPSAIKLYPANFESKEKLTAALSDYNEQMREKGKEEQVITYTDMTATMMSSVTSIINIISYVLIAFVAISLLVSSIMISIITQISVMERTKEIGILRAIGASKRNVSQVFNAETFIIGTGAGMLGVGITELLIIPINSVIHNLTDNTGVNAVLPVSAALILIAISIVITVLSGLLPARGAAKKDPVTALRSE
ncbi:MAG: ATP-binding cassette domain-containing protein [Eubacteriales bacterium]|nr:ATP-binding cassette domain-containing protein [Eubacteriales bacterium]